MMTIPKRSKGKKLGAAAWMLLFAIVITVSGLPAAQIASAGDFTTTSIDVYLDGSSTPIGTITTSDIDLHASNDIREYSGRRNNNSTGYYTTDGSSLKELLEDVLGGSTDDIIRVDVTSPVGPNYTRCFCNPQEQLFEERNAYSDLDSGTPVINPVPAILATASAPVGSSLGDDDSIRLFFGTLSTSEKNIPYFSSNISRIDLYTSGSCPEEHYGY